MNELGQLRSFLNTNPKVKQTGRYTFQSMTAPWISHLQLPCLNPQRIARLMGGIPRLAGRQAFRVENLQDAG